MRIRSLPLALAAAGLWILACGGSDIPTPWSEWEGDQEELITKEEASTRSEPAQQPAGAHPTTTTRQRADVPDNLPDIADAYPEVAAAGSIQGCPDGTELHRGKGRQEEQYCSLTGAETRHGPYISFWGNGQVHEVGPYRGGQRHGLWSEWHRSGQKAGTWRWENGEPRGKVDDP